ncbi:MAG: hypothetical protein PHD87_05295 [Candidatus Cloacimonetes bacterium]|nr:hypothetical protein [Candidatus Cloacimonadota bacterium]
MEPNPYQQHNYPPSADIAPVITTGGWIGTLLLMFIPIVNIILIIVWATSTGENPNRRNFARAYVVTMLISIILGVIIFFVIGAGAAGLSQYLETT